MINNIDDSGYKRYRSRKYPIYSLEEALLKIQVLIEKEGFNPTPTSVAVTHWNYSPSSSGGMRLVSSLIQFGLLDETGKGQSRRIKPSNLSIKILQHPEAKEREKSIAEAALNPTLFREFWEKYGHSLPSDENLKWDLTGGGELKKRKLSTKAVKSFITSFRTTLEYAKLITHQVSDTEQVEGYHSIDEEVPTQPTLSSEVRNSIPTAKSLSDRTKFCLPIQLGGGVHGELHLPNPMKSEEWNRLEAAIESVKNLKTFLVSECSDETNEVS